MLERDRRINRLGALENQLKEQIAEKRKSYEDALIESGQLFNLFKEIKACNILNRYLDILKNNSMMMVKAQNSGNYLEVQQLKVYFDGIIYSIKRLNLKNCIDFYPFCIKYFGIKNYRKMCKFEFLEEELRQLLKNVDSESWEKSNYLDKLIERYQLQPLQR